MCQPLLLEREKTQTWNLPPNLFGESQETFEITKPEDLSKDAGCEFCLFLRLRLQKAAVIKTFVTFHYTGQLMRILTMAYYNPYITRLYDPFITQPTGISTHCSKMLRLLRSCVFFLGFFWWSGTVSSRLDKPASRTLNFVCSKVMECYPSGNDHISHHTSRHF